MNIIIVYVCRVFFKWKYNNFNCLYEMAMMKHRKIGQTTFKLTNLFVNVNKITFANSVVTCSWTGVSNMGPVMMSPQRCDKVRKYKVRIRLWQNSNILRPAEHWISVLKPSCGFEFETLFYIFLFEVLMWIRVWDPCSGLLFIW